MACNDIDFLYPMYADVYYPGITQGAYGNIKKDWVLDQTITCNATSVGGASKQQIDPTPFIEYKGQLVARSKTDLRFDGNGVEQAATNIVITNIRNCDGTLLYKETGGPRKGLGTLYEIATIEPFINPFGQIEYYKMLWRRTDDQQLPEAGES
jgi:hypothetical protein